MAAFSSHLGAFSSHLCRVPTIQFLVISISRVHTIQGTGVRTDSVQAVVYINDVEAKRDVVNRKKHFNMDDIEGRVSLLHATSRFYVVPGASADKEMTERKYGLEAGDSRTAKEARSGKAGVTLTLTSANLSSELQKVSETSAGETSIICKVVHENYRLYMDPKLPEQPSSISDGFKAAFAANAKQPDPDFEKAFGNRFVKTVWVGGVLTLTIRNMHGVEGKSSGGGVDVSVSQGGAGASVSADTIKTKGEVSLDCDCEAIGGHNVDANKQSMSMEQLLALVGDWKHSIDGFVNLQPTRVELGEFAELKYACVM
eukprot:COSAG05_NODE_1783_length_4094_cov_31.065832_3_plen_314_part_00